MGTLEDWGIKPDEIDDILSSRPSLVEGFDLLAVNIFQFSNQWEFAFAKNADLLRTKSRKYTPAQQQYLLATLVRITLPLQDPFRAEPFGILDEIVAERQKRQQDNVSSKGAS